MEKIQTPRSKRAAFIFKSWRRFRKNPLGIFSLGILFIIFFMAMAAPIISPNYPNEIHLGLIYKPPNMKFLLGTDEVGRCVLSRIIYGARSSLLVGIGAVLMSATIGIIIGSIAGYYGGAVDNVLMRITEVIMMIPSLFFAILLVSVLKMKGLEAVILVIGLLGWPSMARIVRSEVLSVKERAYIEASRSMGEKDINILFKEVLPNIITSITVVATMRMGRAILIEASLSFLGLSDPSIITWGRMLVKGYTILTVSWWVAVFPGFAIFITVLGFNLLGDGLRDAFDVRI